jgi:hypothetical protein
MIIKKITKKDLLDIWVWRNDKKSVFFSKHKKKITLEAHNKWFKKNAIAIPYFDFLDHLSSPPGNIKRYYENVPYEISGT